MAPCGSTGSHRRFRPSLPRKHHLHAHGLDPPGQQIHRRGRAEGRDVVGFEVPHHFGQRIDAFLERVHESVVHGAERVRRNPRRGQVRRTLQPDRERMQPWPPGLAAIAILDALSGEACGAGRHQRRIQAAGQQHPVRHVGHQLAVHGPFERMAQRTRHRQVATRCRVLAPGLAVVGRQFPGVAGIDVPGRELRDVRAQVHQRLHLRGHAQSPLGVVTPIQRAYADRVACDQVAPRLRVPQRERENAVQARQETRALVAIQRVEHLAVRACREVVAAGIAQRRVVVDLAVHREREAAVARPQRLRTRARIDDRQPLVRQDRALVRVHPAPVRPAVPLARRQIQRLPAKRGKRVARLQVEHSENRTHGGWPPGPGNKKTKARTGRALVACLERLQQLRAGPPTNGVIDRAMIVGVDAAHHDAPCERHEGEGTAGGRERHGPN